MLNIQLFPDLSKQLMLSKQCILIFTLLSFFFLTSISTGISAGISGLLSLGLQLGQDLLSECVMADDSAFS